MHERVSKTGVKIGGGYDPGYLWNVEVLSQAYSEARQFLSESQYKHLSRQFRELARQEDPTHSETIDVRAIENFFELRDKGGILRKINARVFFACIKEYRTIIVLGAMKKENEGSIPPGDKFTINRQLSLYREHIHSIKDKTNMTPEQPQKGKP